MAIADGAMATAKNVMAELPRWGETKKSALLFRFAQNISDTHHTLNSQLGQDTGSEAGDPKSDASSAFFQGLEKLCAASSLS